MKMVVFIISIIVKMYVTHITNLEIRFHFADNIVLSSHQSQNEGLQCYQPCKLKLPRTYSTE